MTLLEGKVIQRTADILMNCRTILNSKLAVRLGVDPNELCSILWKCNHRNIDFCPHKSNNTDIMWEWCFPDEEES